MREYEWPEGDNRAFDLEFLGGQPLSGAMTGQEGVNPLQTHIIDRNGHREFAITAGEITMERQSEVVPPAIH